MQVLVVGTSPAAVDRVARRLAERGHAIVRCHESGDAPFPCNALVEGRQCPLEQEPVDVVVTTRERPTRRPSLYEAGAACALRRHIPLVATNAPIDPFERWTARTVGRHEDLAVACEEVASAPFPRHGEVAAGAARDVVDGARIDPNGIDAMVHRSRGALKVTIVLPERAVELEGSITARVITALRELDPHVRGIDVSVLEQKCDVVVRPAPPLV